MLVLCAVFGSGLIAPAAPASAGGCVHIHKITYDSKGSDTGSNASVNQEVVVIHNLCAAKNLRNWKLRDLHGFTYTFPRFTLGKDEQVKVHTGKGARNAHNLFWKRDYYIWDNDFDRATLKNRQGVVASRCSYYPSDARSTLC